MSIQKKKYDIETQTLQTLSQKLAGKRSELSDYACNLFADKIAIIDLYLRRYNNNPEIITWLQNLREELKLQGEALWIMHADVLTNLGLKVGRTGMREISGKRTE